MDRRTLAVATFLLGGLLLDLFAAGAARAQGTPLPLPGGPGGAQPPIYSEPGPKTPTIQSPHVAPLESRPEPVAPASATRPSEPAAPAGSAASNGPRVTSFPELTRGVGNSQALLEE